MSFPRSTDVLFRLCHAAGALECALAQGLANPDTAPSLIQGCALRLADADRVALHNEIERCKVGLAPQQQAQARAKRTKAWHADRAPRALLLWQCVVNVMALGSKHHDPEAANAMILGAHSPPFAGSFWFCIWT